MGKTQKVTPLYNLEAVEKEIREGHAFLVIMDLQKGEAKYADAEKKLKSLVPKVARFTEKCRGRIPIVRVGMVSRTNSGRIYTPAFFSEHGVGYIKDYPTRGPSTDLLGDLHPQDYLLLKERFDMYDGAYIVDWGEKVGPGRFFHERGWTTPIFTGAWGDICIDLSATTALKRHFHPETQQPYHPAFISSLIANIDSWRESNLYELGPFFNGTEILNLLPPLPAKAERRAVPIRQDIARFG